MKDQTQTQKQPCGFCKKVRQYGADWTVEWKGQPPIRVHKDCGQSAAKFAPEGVEVRLRPTKELREKFEAEAREKRAREFWASKGLSKEALLKPKPSGGGA
jgi:hypothetical protein